jgi:preprotein translocase subunit YajC
MRLILGTLTAVGIAMASPAAAQAQAGIMPGMQVTDTSGGAVGTVTAVKGDNLLVKTDKHEVMLPKTSFTAAKGKLLFGMTQAQLNAEVEKGMAAASAAIVAGATVKGVGGSQLGTIDSVADGQVTITLQDGKKIAVAQNGLRGNADGTVTIGYSAAQLEALVQDKPASNDSPSAAAATTNTSGE